MIQSSIFTPKLRIFLELDQSKLSPNAIAYFKLNEDGPEFVDMDRARDQVYTEEVMAARKSAVLVDEDGAQVARFSGADGWMKAEKARGSARVVFDLEVDGADAEEE